MKRKVQFHIVMPMLAAVITAGCAIAQGQQPPPAIAAGLNGSSGDASAAFDERIRQRFPIGSDQAVLENELKQEGFVISASVPEAAYQAHHYQFIAQCDQFSMVGRKSWAVLWSADATGKIAYIAGIYDVKIL